jgi:hypothetical protein
MGLTTYADLLLFQLADDPGLPTLSLANSTPAVGSTVTLIGDGAAASEDDMETHWQVSESAGVVTWTEVPSGGNRHGYKATTSQKMWGTNIVESDASFFPGDTYPGHAVIVDAGTGDTISFFTEFDKAGLTAGDATTSETQGMGGDSGSAIFHKVEDSWVLAGLTFAVGLFEGQPGSSSTAVFGNTTFAADLSVPEYRNQILAITAIPEVGSIWLLSAVAAMVGIARLCSAHSKTLMRVLRI